MLVIRLFCSQGMSTGLLVSRMRLAAQKQELEAVIEAFAERELNERIDGSDCVLLGPQIGYMKGRAEKICQAKNIPVDVIPMMDYGMCNGEKVLEFAKKLAGK